MGAEEKTGGNAARPHMLWKSHEPLHGCSDGHVDSDRLTVDQTQRRSPGKTRGRRGLRPNDPGIKCLLQSRLSVGDKVSVLRASYMYSYCPHRVVMNQHETHLSVYMSLMKCTNKPQ